jgi:ABC-type dipeptide/oligopeptide/nickel transport system ATPase component
MNDPSADRHLPSAEGAAPILRFDNLQISFRLHDRTVEAVKGLSFAIAPGEVVALVGESGSGKSVSAMSVLRLLQEPPATYPGGHIWWKGEDVLQMDAKRLLRLRGGEVGMVFQEPMTALNPTMTVGRQVEEALELHTDLDAAGRRARTIELFGQVGIPSPESRLGNYPHEMSGGQRQRVCIAIALACDPALLIADEPTTALDVTIQAQILDQLRKRGMAVLFITHDLGLVRELADRVVVMRHGKMVEEGAVAAVFENPQHPYTRGLMACRPRLDRRVERLPTVAELVDGG